MKEHDLNAAYERRFVCGKCGLPAVKAKVKLAYQGIKIDAELLKCPACGQVFVPEELASGKIRELEMTLEDK